MQAKSGLPSPFVAAAEPVRLRTKDTAARTHVCEVRTNVQGPSSNPGASVMAADQDIKTLDNTVDRRAFLGTAAASVVGLPNVAVANKNRQPVAHLPHEASR